MFESRGTGKRPWVRRGMAINPYKSIGSVVVVVETPIDFYGLVVVMVRTPMKS